MKIDRLGPYQILSQLGRGGMGTVYEGIDLQTGELAAVKLLSASPDDEGFRERFQIEIETLRKLRHPNIVRLFGFGEENGQLFYAMELVAGKSLEQELIEGRRFDWRDVTGIALQTCRALRHAHDRGVIHRDIKPANLLRTSDGQIKLSDFGIARLFGNVRMTNFGSVMGTAEYMAPEQAEGRAVDGRTDLYSLACVMYVLLTRRQVFHGKSLVEILQKQCREKPEPIFRYAPHCPVGLADIVMQLLEKDPDRRIPNAGALARLLEAMEHGLQSQTSAVAPEDAPTDAHAPPIVADPPSTVVPGEVEGGSVEADIGDVALPESGDSGPAPEMPVDLLAPTKVTAAFAGLTPTEPREEPVPKSRFVPVVEDELDRIEPPPEGRGWISLQTAILGAGLILVGLTALYLLQPPSPDALYDRISSQVGTGEVESMRAVENDMHKFVARYPDDPRCDEIQEHLNEIELDRLERKFERHARGIGAIDDLAPVERAYLESIDNVRFDPEGAAARLQAVVDLYGGQEGAAADAAPCMELARRRLEQLRRQIARDVPPQVRLVETRLALAEQLRASDPQRARTICRAVVDLYGDKPWAADLVARARQSLEGDPSRPAPQSKSATTNE